MIKNFGKLKQWTGERFGDIKPTLHSDEFQRMEFDTESRRAGFDHLYEVAKLTHVHLSKKKKISPEDSKMKATPLYAFGDTLMSYGTAHKESSDLGLVMVRLGEVENTVSLLQEEFSDAIKDIYMPAVAQGQLYFKEHSVLKKKLESRRLDYDFKQGRLSKAKKERPEWEQECQVAKMKYDETEHRLVKKMLQIQDYETTHIHALRRLAEIQHQYHQKAAELLNAVCHDWPVLEEDHSMAAVYHTLSNKSHRSTGTYLSNTSPARLRKVLFNFDGENKKELSIRVGEVVCVLGEVDDGWWLGEIDERQGIFPVNYTEDISHSLSNTPPLVSSSETTSKSDSDVNFHSLPSTQPRASKKHIHRPERSDSMSKPTPSPRELDFTNKPIPKVPTAAYTTTEPTSTPTPTPTTLEVPTALSQLASLHVSPATHFKPTPIDSNTTYSTHAPIIAPTTSTLLEKGC
ncbi:hypothetical protein BDF14DRAFT_1909108 [Spinellus fusiger]|nr:hypothetical protein BDF14DRAFT_1909108 [Spinellus fusiger]